MQPLKIIYQIFTLALICWLFLLCKKTEEQAKTSGPYLNLSDTVQYVGMATCRSCHDEVHKTFSQTGMGRSFHYATRQKSDAIFDKHALVYDTLNDFYYFPFLKTIVRGIFRGQKG